MNSNIDREVYKELALKYKLPIAVLETCVEAMYTDLKNTIQDSTQDGFMVPYFGKFVQTSGMLQKIEWRRRLYVDSKRKFQDCSTESESTEPGV